MQGAANAAITEITDGKTAHPLLIIVPRARLDLCRSLSHSLGDDAKVQVSLDRRSTDRRVRADVYQPERRRGDRRLRPDTQAELRAGRWIVIPRASWRIDFLDPDTQAILFLCCGEHVVPCQPCQDTYRLGWIPRVDHGVFHCPVCENDLTPLVVAHAQACRYWANRATGTKKPPVTSPPHLSVVQPIPKSH
jgi:hypothetical protein